MKKVLYLSLTLFLTAILIHCKDTNANFSPGPADPRILGTWQLIERQYSAAKDSFLVDSVLVPAQYVLDSTLKDGAYVKDSIYVNAHFVKDSVKVSYYADSLVVLPDTAKQTLSFGSDGKLIANGSQMTYYAPIKYFLIDSTVTNGLGINFYIYTNRANVAFWQGVSFQGKDLLLLPRCGGNCYSKFRKVN